MTNERWAKLKTVTWFSAEQDEVMIYVEQLRGLLCETESVGQTEPLITNPKAEEVVKDG